MKVAKQQDTVYGAVSRQITAQRAGTTCAQPVLGRDKCKTPAGAKLGHAEN
jgi:hypothetical protein